MKKVFFLFVFFLCAPHLSAQPQAPKLPEKVKVKLPKILDGTELPKLEEDLFPQFSTSKNCKWGQDRTVEQTWVVYSDRNNNQTYSTPEGTNKLTTLSFGEEVCIAEIRGDMALVYTDNRHNYPKIPSYAKPKGWISLEKLLLWKKCPTDTRGVQMKGIIAINLNNMQKGSTFNEKLYKNPEELNKSDKLNMDMNFYYIMKETPDKEFALLCTGAQFSQTTLYGWVHKTAYTLWNQRTCLEPNWNKKFVEEHRGDKTYTYDDDARSKIVTEWKFGNTNGETGIDKYRMNQNLLRFPVLGQVNRSNNMILCTSFADRTGNINTGNGFVSINGKVNSVGQNMLQMNIILAIEATTEMRKFMSAIQGALSKCKEYAAQGLKVRVGLVFYRDLVSDISQSDIMPLCNYDDPQLLGKLQTGSANTRLVGERNVSLCQAIETAVMGSTMGFTKKQSNMLLVIGYHGTSEKEWKGDHLQSLLKENNIQLASIQVMRSAIGSSCRYHNLLTDLIKKNIEGQYNAIAAKAKFKPAPDNDGYIYVSSRKEGNPLFASVRFNSMQDQELKPDVLSSLIKSTINGFSKSIIDAITIYEEGLKDIGFYEEFMIAKLGKKSFEAWKQVKAISAYAGYAQIKDLGESDNWRAILYLSSDELKGLIQQLETVNRAFENKENDRNVFVNAMRELLRRQLGGSISDKVIQDMTPDELESAIYGIVNIPSENMRFTKHSLKDLMNRKAVSDEEYFDMLDNFSKKLKKLRGYLRDYKYCLEVGDEHGAKMRYYWIPLEDLP